MKRIKLLFMICMVITLQSVAQNKTCNLMDGQLHEVYVFTKNTSHTMIELFGERTASNVINLAYVKTYESKQEVDSLCLAGKLYGTFIFPNKDADKTIRFCTEKEYAEALKNKMELKIEEE